MSKIEELEGMLNFQVQRLLSEWIRDKTKPRCSSFPTTGNLSLLYDEDGYYQWEALLTDGSTPRFQEKTKFSGEVPTFKQAKKWFDSLKDEERPRGTAYDRLMFADFKRKFEPFETPRCGEEVRYVAAGQLLSTAPPYLREHIIHTPISLKENVPPQRKVLNQTDVNEWLRQKRKFDSDSLYELFELPIGNGLFLIERMRPFAPRELSQAAGEPYHVSHMWCVRLGIKNVSNHLEIKMQNEWFEHYIIPTLMSAQEWAKPYLKGNFDIAIQINKDEWSTICK